MEKSSVFQNICVNCAYEFEFQSEEQNRSQNFSFLSNSTRDGLAEIEVQIVDAIFYVFGMYYHDLYPEINQIPKDSHAGVVLCSDCTQLFKKLYDSFMDLKKASHNKNALLWHSLKLKRNEVTIKQEFENNDNVPTHHQKFHSTNAIKIGKRENFTENNYEGEGNESEIFGEFTDVQTPHMYVTEGLFDEGNLMDDPLTPSGEHNEDIKNVRVFKQELGAVPVQTNVRFGKKGTKARSMFIEQQKRIIRLRRKGDNSHKDGAKLFKMKSRKRGRYKSKRKPKYIEWKVDHLDSLNGVAPIKCCNTSFQTDDDFIAHASQHHQKESDKPEQECSICKKKIISKYMAFHMSVLHQGKLMVFECKTCKKTFSTEWYMRKHYRKEHSTRRTPRNWSHLNGKKGSKVFCDICKKYFSYNYYTRYHMDVMHNNDGRRYQCEICGSSVKSEVYLKDHMSMYHGPNKSKICDKCGKVFSNHMGLNKHKRIHEADVVTDKEKFKCTQCGIILKHTAGLKKHIRVMHGKASLNIITCEICGKTTKTRTNMRIHMKVHDPNRNFKVEKGNTATNPENMNFPNPVDSATNEMLPIFHDLIPRVENYNP